MAMTIRRYESVICVGVVAEAPMWSRPKGADPLKFQRRGLATGDVTAETFLVAVAN